MVVVNVTGLIVKPFPELTSCLSAVLALATLWWRLNSSFREVGHVLASLRTLDYNENS